MRKPSRPGRETGWLSLIILLGAALRLPFLIAARDIPVDGDTAIIGLMALNRVLTGTMWGQPYGSPVEAWAALPFIEVLGPTRLAIRLSYVALSLSLPALGWGLARAIHPRAGLPTAALLASPPAFLITMAALPRPLYPMVSALVAAQLLATLALSRPSRSKLHFAVLATAWTALGALAVWTHTVSALAVAASGAYLVGKLRTSLPRAVMLVIGLGFALSPVAVLMVLVEGGSGVLAGGLEHAWSVTRQLPLALSELTGGRAHVIVDGGENVPVPSWVQLTLAVLYGAATVVTLRTRPRGGALMLAGAATLMILASLFPLRATPGAVRFMMPAYVPLVVVLVSGLRARSGAAAWLFVILVGALHLVPLPRLLGEWQKAAHSSVIFPECSLERRMLEAFGIDRGFASYNMAYCITYESGQRTIVSQPWNERFIGHSLPYRDEVRFAGRLAWIVRPGYDFGLHSPAQFERDLRKAGGDWTQIRLGDSRVFLDFEPPFGPWVTRAVPSPVSSGEEVPGEMIYKLPGDRPVHGLTLVPGRRGETLPSDLDVEVSEDGVTYVRVWRQRHLRSNWRLTWLNGHPEPANDGAALAMAVAGRRIAEVRVRYPVPQPEASSVGALLVHEVRNGVWPESSGDGWRARYEELVSVPRPDTAWWLYRRSVAERNLP